MAATSSIRAGSWDILHQDRPLGHGNDRSRTFERLQAGLERLQPRPGAAFDPARAAELLEQLCQPHAKQTRQLVVAIATYARTARGPDSPGRQRRLSQRRLTPAHTAGAGCWAPVQPAGGRLPLRAAHHRRQQVREHGPGDRGGTHASVHQLWDRCAAQSAAARRCRPHPGAAAP